MAWLQDALKNPELINAFNHLSQRLVNELQYPTPRTQSLILPRLSDATTFYLAFPNYGQTLHQAQQIFQEELRNSPAMQDFLHKNKLEQNEPKFEQALQKLYELSEYLGDEVVLTGSFKGKEPSGVLIAEVRKPGLKEFLEKTSQELEPMAKEHLRVFEPQQLQTATDQPGQAPPVLLRPDLVLIGFNTATLRNFNAQLDRSSGTFAASALGKRLAQSYQAGVGVLMAADLQNLLGLVPENPPQAKAMLEKTGFADMKYAVVESKFAGKNSTTQMELAFNGPRRSVASWIAAPGPLGSLDFMSPKSYIAEAFRLKSPAQMFDDIVELAGPNALAMLPQMEAQFNVNLKQDILSKLGGELAFEMQAPPVPPANGNGGHMAVQQPKIKVILSVTDPAGLEQTLKRLLAQAPMPSDERVEDGVTFHSLGTPSGTEVNYFFLDGYLVITSSRELAQETVRLHRSGESLARSSQVAAQGQPVKASVIAYQNSGPFLAALANQLPQDTAALFSKMLSGGGDNITNVIYGYADETSLRGTAKNSITTDASLGLIVAAVAIPNLLRSRMAANEATAAASLRTVNIAEVTYRTNNPKRGYAPTLATLGPGAGDCSEANVNPAHACLLDDVLGNANCTAGKWCDRSGYRFSIRGVCLQTNCRGYVVTATPISTNTGGKSFCSTTDAVIRSHAGPPLTTPLTVADCKAWEPMH